MALVFALTGCAATPRVTPDVSPSEPVTSTSVVPTRGAVPELVPVPSVRGKSVEIAEWKLQQVGLKTRVTWKRSSIRRGKVLAQNPSRGSASSGTTVVLTVSSGSAGDTDEKAPQSTGALSASDRAAMRAYQDHLSGIALSGVGSVADVLADDTEGGRHQRFILRLESGQTLLVAHNIDIAPRLPSLAPGDRVVFSGVYEWNDKGGTVHWTHDDPDGSHPGGWLKFNGSTYR